MAEKAAAVVDIADSERISRLRAPADSEVSPATRRAFEELRESGGPLNYLRAHALNEANMKRLSAYLYPLLDPDSGRLPYVERELIAMVTSAETGCSYCQINHVRPLGAAMGSKARARRISYDYRKVAELTERERALCDFAAAIANDPHSLTDADFDRLREFGLDDNQILEAIEIASIFAGANRLCIAMGVPPDEAFFAADLIEPDPSA